MFVKLTLLDQATIANVLFTIFRRALLPSKMMSMTYIQSSVLTGVVRC